jgi:hypothetical protein
MAITSFESRVDKYEKTQMPPPGYSSYMEAISREF